MSNPEPAENAAVPPADTSAKKHTVPALPMGWTRVKRRRKKSTSSNDEMEWCCDDPACPRPSGNRPLEGTTETNAENESAPGVETFQGQAIVCLHEFDASWFQGYFLPNNSKKPWGLLAQEEELDECLECADGGYRRVVLTAFPSNRKKVSWEHVEWTGGDMMKLNGGKEVTMDTKRLLTGVKAVPYVKRYFGSILEKLGNDNDDNDSDDQSILEMLPDVAVVIGRMSITLPKLDSDEGFVRGSLDV